MRVEVMFERESLILCDRRVRIGSTMSCSISSISGGGDGGSVMRTVLRDRLMYNVDECRFRREVISLSPCECSVAEMEFLLMVARLDSGMSGNNSESGWLIHF